ncbi:hypothetical protein EJB05_12889, partial [Eragrostis curvula]
MLHAGRSGAAHNHYVRLHHVSFSSFNLIAVAWKPPTHRSHRTGDAVAAANSSRQGTGTTWSSSGSAIEAC